LLAERWWRRSWSERLPDSPSKLREIALELSRAAAALPLIPATKMLATQATVDRNHIMPVVRDLMSNDANW